MQNLGALNRIIPPSQLQLAFSEKITEFLRLFCVPMAEAFVYCHARTYRDQHTIFSSTPLPPHCGFTVKQRKASMMLACFTTTTVFLLCLFPCPIEVDHWLTLLEACLTFFLRSRNDTDTYFKGLHIKKCFTHINEQKWKPHSHKQQQIAATTVGTSRE